MAILWYNRQEGFRKETINLARRFQSGLGTELTRRYKEGQRVDTIKLMSVVKVNYKYNTVDLVALYKKETFQGSYTNEGRYSAKLPMEFGGRNIAGKPYGEVNPIAVGTKVLVGFVEASKNNPIILAVYADNEVTEKLSRAPFSSADPRDEDLAQQMYQKFALYPSLTYDSIDGEGTRVVTFSGKSFVVFDTAAYNNATMVSDGNYGTTYEDLGSSFYADGEVIEPMEGRAPNVLFKHQGILDADDEPDNHDFMIHISPDGDYRTSIMNKEQDWRTYFEMDNEGQVRLRRQEDTVQLDAPQEIGEIVIDKYGVVSLRNGETNLEVRKDGLYSGGKPLGSALNLDLREIEDKISGINRDIISQNSRIGEIESGFEVLSDKTGVIDGDLSKHEARLTVLSDEINSKVSRDQVDAIVNEGLEDISQDIRDIRAGTEEANKKIEGIVDDNLVTPSEKKDLLGEWEIIQNEYLSYVDQANLYEVSSDAYESAYAQLKDFIEPILEDMAGVYPVDGTVLRNRFKSYYSSRLGLLEDVFKNFQEGIMEAMQKAAKAQTTALEAQTQIADTNEDLKHTNGLIDDIADDGMLTPSEKYQLRKEWQNIEAEHQTTLEQGQRYDVRTDQFELAHQLLENMLDPIFEDMRETTSVDGNVLRQRIQGYYEAKRDLLKEISDLNKEVMEDYGERIDHAETNINQTAEQIKLMANRVQTIGNDLETALARIDVNADEISSRVTEETMYEFIDDKIADISVGGVNLYVVYTQTNGWLDSYTGEVRDPDNDSVVSDYIRVKGNTPYVISLFENTGNNTISVAWYNTTRRFISGDAVSGEDEFYEKYTSPEDAQFLRVSYKKSDVVKIKVETGTTPTDFDYAWEDIKNDQDLLEEYMRNIEKQAQKTEEKATDAEYNAKIANDELADLADDDILSPTDKKQAQLQWNQIQEEYPVNIEQANRFNASSESYKNSYETLERYIEPLIKYPEQKSIISGNTFRKTFSDYYTKRTILLNRIAEIAQESAENANKRADNLDNEVSRVNEATKQAQIAAENAQESADKANQSVEVAQRDAQRANEEIADIADDNVLAPSEKQQLKYPWAEIQKEYPKNVIQAQEFNTSSESYENAYKDLESFAEPLFNKMDEKSVVDGSILQDKFGEYYDQRVDLLNAISSVAKNRADKAQEDLDNLDINDRNILLDSKKRTIERSNSDHKYIIYQLSEEELTKNKFVFSGKVEVTNGSYGKFTATFSDEDYTSLGSYEISLGEEGRFSYAITSDKVKNATEIHVYAGINGSTSNNAANLLNFKLQEGNRATAWTPAPEDTRDEALDLARKYTDSQIDITTDAINLSVEETKEYADSSSSKAREDAIEYTRGQIELTKDEFNVTFVKEDELISAFNVNQSGLSLKGDTIELDGNIVLNKLNSSMKASYSYGPQSWGGWDRYFEGTWDLNSNELRFESDIFKLKDGGKGDYVNHGKTYFSADQIKLREYTDGSEGDVHGDLMSRLDVNGFNLQFAKDWSGEGGVILNSDGEGTFNNRIWVGGGAFFGGDVAMPQHLLNSRIEPRSDWGTWRINENYINGIPRIYLGKDSPLARIEVPWHYNAGNNSGEDFGFRIGKDNRSVYYQFAHTYHARTYSNSANFYLTSNNVIGRATSASKYKLNITHLPESESVKMGNRLLSLNPAKWWDKTQTEDYAEELSGNDNFADTPRVYPFYGLIAEDLRDAGLDGYISYNEKTKEIEGIEYDKLWTILIPVIRKQREDIEDLKKKIIKLEQGRLS